MAQTNFYGSRRDWLSILESILASTSALVICDAWYDTKDIQFFEHANEMLLTQLQKKRNCFLISRSLSNDAHLGFVQQKLGPKKGKFRIDVQRLPSGLQLTLPACFEENGMTLLNSGVLVCHQEVFNHANLKWERTESVRLQLYDECRVNLVRQLKKLVLGKNTIKIGPDALELVSFGKAKIIVAANT
jgi:hypothetical protein